MAVNPVAFVLVSFVFGAYGSPCDTPDGKRGVCVDLDECEPLLNLITGEMTPADLAMVKKSVCEPGDVPKLCCPLQESECATAEGDRGRCVGIDHCPHMKAMLKPPVRKRTVRYLREARCEGPEHHSICCGPPPSSKQATPKTATTTTTPTPTSPLPLPLGNHMQLNQCTLTAELPDPETKCCGVESGGSNKIIGGSVTSIDEHPWLTLIEYKPIVGPGGIQLLCGGTLITGRHVLTAGHCVAGSVVQQSTPVNVRLGEYNLTTRGPDCVKVGENGLDCTDGVLSVPILTSRVHPNYNPDSELRRDDIAIIVLNKLVEYTDFIRPICLPTTDITLKNRQERQHLLMFVAGWGMTSPFQPHSIAKMQVRLPYKTMDECEPNYKKRNIDLWSKQICAGGEPGKDSCKGDSGGPLMHENGLTFELAGVISFGPNPCAQKDFPGVYTKVYDYLEWIRENVKHEQP